MPKEFPKEVLNTKIIHKGIAEEIFDEIIKEIPTEIPEKNVNRKADYIHKQFVEPVFGRIKLNTINLLIIIE